MKFEIGDIVSGAGIFAGEIKGVEKVKVGNQTIESYLIIDKTKFVKCFVPLNMEGSIRPLPKPRMVKKIMKDKDQILKDLTKKVTTKERYDFIKGMLESNNNSEYVKAMLLLIHLDTKKKTTVAEKRLFNKKFESFAREMAFVVPDVKFA